MLLKVIVLVAMVSRMKMEDDDSIFLISRVNRGNPSEGDRQQVSIDPQTRFGHPQTGNRT